MKALLSLALLILLTGCSKQTDPKEDTPVVSVRVEKVKTTDLPVRVEGTAMIYPREQANVTARITAPIERLRVRKGDKVAAGQILATLENRDLAAQYEQSKGAVEDASANLQKVTSGTLPADLERARSQKRAAEATLAQAKANLERRKRLFFEGAISSRDLLQSETDLTTAQANFAAVSKELELLLSQSQKADIRIAQSKLHQAEAQEQAAAASLSFSEVRAPFSGEITEQYAYPGDVARADTPIFTVMDLSKLIARAQIPEASSGEVRPDQSCHFSIGDSKEQSWAGRVTVVSGAIDPVKRTVEAWCEIGPERQGLKAGVYGTVAIETGLVHNALTIASGAVEFQEGTKRGTVFIVDRNNTAHAREVLTGQQTANQVQIQSGLAAGDTVITEGAYGLSDGAHVQIQAGNPGKAE